MNPPLALLAEEKWAQVNDALNHWSNLAEKGKVEAMKHRQEVNDLQTRVTNTCLDLQSKVTNAYHCSTEVTDAMQGMHQLLDHVCTRYEGQNMPDPSPCTLATQALYANWGSNKETIDYKHCLHTQACFEDPWPSRQSRIK